MMDEELRDRDRLEAMMRAHGEVVPDDALPPGLVWHVWCPRAQRLYEWRWALHGGWLYACLHDQERAGPCQRLPLTRAAQAAFAAVARHLAPWGLGSFALRGAGACLGAC
jgi:hypothetical protein